MSVDELCNVCLHCLVNCALAPLVHEDSLLQFIVLCPQSVDLLIRLDVFGRGKASEFSVEIVVFLLPLATL